MTDPTERERYRILREQRRQERALSEDVAVQALQAAQDATGCAVRWRKHGKHASTASGWFYGDGAAWGEALALSRKIELAKLKLKQARGGRNGAYSRQDHDLALSIGAAWLLKSHGGARQRFRGDKAVLIEAIVAGLSAHYRLKSGEVPAALAAKWKILFGRKRFIDAVSREAKRIDAVGDTYVP